MVIIIKEEGLKRKRHSEQSLSTFKESGDKWIGTPEKYLK